MTPRRLERLLLDAGWRRMGERGRGSHRLYSHLDRPGIVVLPWHQNRDLPQGTLNSILKMAGLKWNASEEEGR